MPAVSARLAAMIVAAATLLALSTAPASATDYSVKSDLTCLATAIYFEARGESERGQRAIAEVVIARTKSGDHPATICGVVYEGARNRHCQFSFACDGRSDAARDAKCWARPSASPPKRSTPTIPRSSTARRISTSEACTRAGPLT